MRNGLRRKRRCRARGRIPSGDRSGVTPVLKILCIGNRIGNASSRLPPTLKLRRTSRRGISTKPVTTNLHLSGRANMPRPPVCFQNGRGGEDHRVILVLRADSISQAGLESRSFPQTAEPETGSPPPLPPEPPIGRRKHCIHEWFKEFDPLPAAGGMTIAHPFRHQITNRFHSTLSIGPKLIRYPTR